MIKKDKIEGRYTMIVPGTQRRYTMTDIYIMIKKDNKDLKNVGRSEAVLIIKNTFPILILKGDN